MVSALPGYIAMAELKFGVSGLVAASAGLGLVVVLLLQWVFRNRRRGGLPVPPGSMGWPVLGETLQLISAYKTTNPEPFVDKRRAWYGNLFKTHLFGKPTIFSTDPEVNKFILQNEGKLFQTSYPSSITNLLGKHSLLLISGNLHKRLHSLTLSFANSSALKDHLMLDIEKLVCLTLDGWNDQVLLQDETKKITFELTVKQILSFDPGQWSENLRKEYLQLIDGFFSLPLRLPFTTYGKALKARAKVAEELRAVVKKRRNESENSDHYDMLAALLNEKSEGESLSDDQIIDLLLSLLVAGYETTSTIMTLAVKFLTETPKALAELKEEHETIRRHKVGAQRLEWNDFKCMIFTQCVISETLRIANIISGVFRKALCDVEIKDYTIPKDWLVFPCFRAVHLDEDNYSNDARKFNPWRWQGKQPSINGGTFTPFGGGPRLCPGYELARVGISVFLHHMVTLFCWEVIEEDKLIFFPTTRTVKRYPIKLTRRGRRSPLEI
ncbi:hypothetical protein SUGI_0840560 [Cryptomeria japonica]|uniref:3beta,22alpha-dihydroxysteroid 3-dehydrogenase n=1 Tax=Cryptomeria japonica TaxID=3369 RepID=UPI0024149AF0|nr:3beta,22alpha-dihydroxysteroid 3-dehydrogenase [Cryptomeria japonica]GLJ40696.1 hypothetical protein SUGI_0840560 [Cryptomeria japonica]